jgi:eukaryotic-like serine/threonine-protein kinase
LFGPALQPATIAAVRIGATIGQYRVLRRIGEGGMGVVFEAEHVLIGRKAAIKVLKPEVSQGRNALERFFNEARATAAIHDAGIPQLFDVGVTRDKSAYIIMELLAGESLDARLRRVGVLSPAIALQIVRQAACTLGVVHGLGIVHRDLKPGNLFLAQEPAGERVKILDFGVAKLGPELRDGLQTHDGVIVGTPVYMSPEQCSGTTIDHRADVYSLGCVLFRVLAGRPPFTEQGAGPVIAAHLGQPPPPPSKFTPDLPLVLDDLVLRCLAKSREDRFPSMADFVAECDRLLDSSPSLAAPRQLPEATTVTLDGQPTTLGEAMGEKSTTIVPWPRWLAFAAIGVAIGIIAAVALSGRGGDERSVGSQPVPIEVAKPAADAPAVVTVDAAPAPRVEPEVAEPEIAKPPVAKPAAKPTGVAKPRPKPRSGTDLYEDRN